MRLPSKIGFAFFVLAALVCFGAADVSSYQKSVDKWRQDYETKLKADDGWLTVAALLWLHEGTNRFGSAAGNDIVLPYSYVPATAGTFDLHQGKTIVHVNPGVPITLAGKPVESMELRPDSKQDRLAIGDLVFFVHASGTRYAIRVKDKNNPLRKEFKGLHWFPVNEAYRFNARYVAYPSPREVQVENMLGDRGSAYLAGYVAFTMNGKEYQLDAEDNGDGSLFIVFRDLTSKTSTYPAARFLDTDPPRNGKVEIDFNKAYNPPCAYNPYATCPLPSEKNRLPVEIPVGEKRYH
ncbi:MAG TPA: DUF1684 domain-containing protein [Candidatus Angelobacter sp.]|jgi:hypothetical protein